MAKALAPSLGLLFSLVADKPHAPASEDAAARIRGGFKWSQARPLQETFQIKDDVFARIIGVSGRTLTRTRKTKASLDLAASDRLYRLAKVLKMAVQVLEDLPSAVRWLQRGQPGLAGCIPLQLLDTEPGTEKVELLLRQLEYGVLP